MSSRNVDGSRILQSNVDKACRHTGSAISVGDSQEDEVLSRESDTSYRISLSGTTHQESD